MDRYTGLAEMGHDEAAQLLLERQEWEADQAAQAEYESWYLWKTMAEGRANGSFFSSTEG
jgi:hypothetical protein